MAQETGLTVNISNIAPPEGMIHLALYNNTDDFPKKGKEYKILKIKVYGKSITYSIKNLPPGKYAIALFHDLNGDGICNKNKLGIPIEGYGFSNNIRPKLGAPPFRKTAFEINQSVFLEISMIY
jgi:uncharacterized protein (DUF2141 family)